MNNNSDDGLIVNTKHAQVNHQNLDRVTSLITKKKKKMQFKRY